MDAQRVVAARKAMCKVFHGVEVGPIHGRNDNRPHSRPARTFDHGLAVGQKLHGVQVAVCVDQHFSSGSASWPFSIYSCRCASAASAGSCVTMAKAVPNSRFTFSSSSNMLSAV